MSSTEAAQSALSDPESSTSEIFANFTDLPTKGTDDPIVKAAINVLADLGPRHTSMDDIAKKAGVSRITLYRKYGDKESLLLQVLMAESQRCLAMILKDIGNSTTMEEKFVDGFVATVELAVTHPLFSKIFAEGRDEESMQLLSISASRIIDLGRDYMSTIISGLQTQGYFVNLDSAKTAELLVRLWQSIVFVPSERLSAYDREDLVAYAREFLYPMLNR